jgi:hypothetical protein
MARGTMHEWLQQCPHCDYCAPRLSTPPIDPAAYDTLAYRRAIRAPDLPPLARRFAAYAAALEPSDPLEAGIAALQSAWACDDAHERLGAQNQRLLAVRLFQQGHLLVPDDTRVALGTIVVDILRRAREFGAAKRQGESLLTTAGIDASTASVLRFQLTLIDRHDDDAHTASECAERLDF